MSIRLVNIMWSVVCVVTLIVVFTESAGGTPSKPNIILFLTDDQDLTLGGWTPMQQTQTLLVDAGCAAENYFVNTPVCCPSRAEILTGRYFHNIKTAKPTDPGCMHTRSDPHENSDWNSWLFAPHLADAGYDVGIFGKYLNAYVPVSAPPGVNRWFANDGGDYLNPTFNDDGKIVHFNASTHAGYSTSIIGNTSLSWIQKQLGQQRQADQPSPFMAYIALKAPHVQDCSDCWQMATPAPWYQDSFPSAKAPRTPTWNYSAPYHHWLIRSQPPMTDLQAQKSDELYRSRWQSLLSVDDLVKDVVGAVESAGALNNTYFLFTSDHGFRFGQFRMPQGKWNVYENDIRVPFVIRGPGVQPGSKFASPASHVDLMPTILDMAGVQTPATMDGSSVLPLVTSRLPSADNRRDVLVEYSLQDVVRYEHLEDAWNNTFRALRVVDNTPGGLGQLLYAEFTDGRYNWNFTDSDSPFNEYELFDVVSDPHQMHNLYSTASPDLLKMLRARLQTLSACQGVACRAEG